MVDFLDAHLRVRVSQKDRNRLEAVAEKRGVRPGAVIREGLLLFLEAEEQRLGFRKKAKR